MNVCWCQSCPFFGFAAGGTSTRLAGRLPGRQAGCTWWLVSRGLHRPFAATGLSLAEQSGLKKEDLVEVIKLGAIAAPMFALKVGWGLAEGGSGLYETGLRLVRQACGCTAGWLAGWLAGWRAVETGKRGTMLPKHRAWSRDAGGDTGAGREMHPRLARLQCMMCRGPSDSAKPALLPPSDWPCRGRANCENLQGPTMAARTYAPAFPLKHQQKDMRLAIALGDNLGQPLPTAAAANELYKQVWRFP